MPITESIAETTVVSPGQKIASAPRAIVDCTASITPEEFSTGTSRSSMPRFRQLTRARSMKRRELLSALLWGTPTFFKPGWRRCATPKVKSTGARLP